MKKYIIALIPAIVLAKFSATISPISSQIKDRMIKGNSYHSGCPIALKDLRYIKLTYLGFDNKEHMGELIVNKSVAKEVVDIFKQLYQMRYPIRKMELVSNYRADDFASIEADNTSAFNCRFVEGTHKWSNHTYGKAIDINPIENPYVTNSGHTSHKASKKYLKRVRINNSAPYRAMILKGDKIVKIFKSYGWRWGGEWKCCKDLQHFDKK